MVNTPKNIVQSTSSTLPLSPHTPSTPPIKHWFRPDASSASAMMMTSTPEQRPITPQFDPTYGFAAYAQSQPGDYYQDILYPLRTSTSNPSSPNSDNVEPNGTKRKRVKFNTVVSSVSHTASPNHIRRPDAFHFGASNGYVSQAPSAPSLRSRIVDFFANLF